MRGGILMIGAWMAVSSAAVAEPCGGDLVSVGNGAAVELADAIRPALPGGVIALGERHGVEAHPQAAACLLRFLSSSSRPTLVMEHLTDRQQPVVDAYRAWHPEVSSGLGAALSWWTTGWPAWTVYAPLFEAAWQRRVPVRGGDRDVEGVTDGAERIAIRFGDAAEAVHAGWAQAMSRAHCGLIDEKRARALGQRQMLRDIAMADAVASMTGAGPVLFYAGRAHVRGDRSVPWLLTGAPYKPVVSIALWESRTGGHAVDRDAVRAELSGRVDYVWFTGDLAENDLCTRLHRLSPDSGKD